MNTQMENKLRLSIIIPVYNVEKYIGRCLDSLLSQDLNEDEFEIIVVNDGSTDSSLRIAEEYRLKFKNVRIISQRNQGISVARNSGLDVAEGKYIYFIDSDDFLLRNSLNHLLALAEKNDADILTFKSRSVDEQNSKAEDIKECDVSNFNYQVLTGLEADEKGVLPLILTAWFFIVKREYLLKHSLRFIPDLRYSEDFPVTLPMFLKAQRVAVTDIDAHRYMQRLGSARHGVSTKQKLEMMDYDIKCSILVNVINNKWQGVRSENGYKRTLGHLNALSFVSILRMVRLGIPSQDIGKRMKLLKEHGLYPVGHIPAEHELDGVKFKVLHWMVNRQWIIMLASSLMSRLKK